MEHPIRWPPCRAAEQNFLLVLASQSRCTEGFDDFITSVVTPTATGWNNICRAGFAPAEDARLCRSHGYSPPPGDDCHPNTLSIASRITRG
jgi:hypothetical protein